MKADVRRRPKIIAVRALALDKAVGDFECLIPGTLDIR